MIDLILQEDTWNEAQHSFQLSIPCPFCGQALARENTHHLTRCSNCNGLLEWVLHEGETNLYWPRTIGDNFSSFDGRRYNHTSFFDNAELGGDQGKTSGNLEPDLAIWNIPTNQETFELKNPWKNPGGSAEKEWEEKFQFPIRVIPQSLLVMHGDLIVARNDGGITTFKGVDGPWENVRREEFPSVFSSNRMYDTGFRYRPCGRFPYVLISNEQECIIWKHSFGTTTSKHEKFELPSELLEKQCYMMGSPTSFYNGNKLAFVMTMVARQQSDGSYICAFVQDEMDGPFRMIIMQLAFQLDHPALYSRTQECLVSMLLQGQRFVRVPVDMLWDATKFEERMEDRPYLYTKLTRQNWFNSYLGHQYKFNQFDCMAIQSKHNEEHLVVAFESLRTNQLYVAHINLRSLDSLNDSSWRVVEVKDGITGPVQAMAVGSCKGHLREGQILLNTVALTLQNGIALIDMSSGQTCGSFIPDDTGRVQTTYKDPAIISNAGVVSKVGSTLSLSWDMLEWGAPVGFDEATRTIVAMGQKILRHPLKSEYKPGLTMLNNRIFVSRYSHTEGNGLEIYKIEAIDIVKMSRDLKK